jgi:hypothetical protein
MSSKHAGDEDGSHAPERDLGRAVGIAAHAPLSVGVFAGILDDLCPARLLGFDELSVACLTEPVVGHHSESQGLFTLDQFRVLQGHAQSGVELLENREWRAARSVYAMSDLDVEVFQARFGQCRRILQRR